MAVFSNEDFDKVMEEDGDIIILNMDMDNNMTAVGYDLSIGFICDAETGIIPETYAEDSNRYILKSGQRYLVISREFLYLSPRYMATLHSRISYALKGIIVTSTLIDPNYVGFVMGTLFNCTSNDIYIKKNNPFVTMVVHEFRTPTTKYLRKNDQNKPMDALATLYSKYPNIAKDARDAAVIHWTKAWEEIKYEYEAAKELMYKKMQKKNVLSLENRKRIEITFLIGNGFDLSVGLRTKYTDFYKYYLARNEDELSREIKRGIKEDKDNWSDLELALGKVTENIKDKEVFWKCESVLEDCLLEYLDEQMKRINMTDRMGIAYNMRYSLTGFYEEFQENIKSYIKKILSGKSGQIEYSFITFNYTDVLERCLKVVQAQSMDEPFARIGERVIHIHGATRTGDIVLGVNDDSQIANKEYRNNSSDRQRFIKEEIIGHNGNANIEKAYDIIDGSSIICIFGMSLGVTDKKWWKRIAKWLQADNARRLIIFARDNETYKITKFTVPYEEEVKNTFKDNGELAEVWERIQDQIYVKVNANIFNFKLYER